MNKPYSHEYHYSYRSFSRGATGLGSGYSTSHWESLRIILKRTWKERLILTKVSSEPFWSNHRIQQDINWFKAEGRTPPPLLRKMQRNPFNRTLRIG